MNASNPVRPVLPRGFIFPGAAPDHTPQQLADDERQAALAIALRFIRDGRPGRALYVMVRSVERQNRILGGGSLPVTAQWPGVVR